MDIETQIADWSFRAVIAVLSGSVLNTTILSFLAVTLFRQGTRIERLEARLDDLKEDVTLLMGRPR